MERHDVIEALSAFGYAWLCKLIALALLILFARKLAITCTEIFTDFNMGTFFKIPKASTKIKTSSIYSSFAFSPTT